MNLNTKQATILPILLVSTALPLASNDSSAPLEKFEPNGYAGGTISTDGGSQKLPNSGFACEGR